MHWLEEAVACAIPKCVVNSSPNYVQQHVMIANLDSQCSKRAHACRQGKPRAGMH